MHGRNLQWPAVELAVIFCLSIAAGAQAQEYAPGTPAGNGYAAATDSGATGTPMAAAPETYMVATPAAAGGLEGRVAELEAALKKMKDKEAAAQKKAEGQPTFVIGGLIQYDLDAFGGENAKTTAQFGDIIDGVKPRRLRLQVSGDAFYNMDYKAEVEFMSTTRPKFKDVYFTVKELPYAQNVRVGHFKEPFGLEQLTSDRFSTFMERSMGDEGFIVPSRDIGAMAFGWSENERSTYAVGVFLNEPQIEDPPQWPVSSANTAIPAGFVSDDRSQAALTMRYTFLPWYDEATDRGLWHCGLAYSYRADEGLRKTAAPYAGAGVIYPDYAVRPEAYLAPTILSTSGLIATDNQLFGVEQAFVYGSLSLQGELFTDFINRPDGLSNVTYTGAYGYVSYFLTGESRAYNRKAGTFDRVRPFTNFFRVCTCDDGVQSGWGAWEVGYRFSYVNMYDGIDAASRTAGMGRAGDHTVGLNWYLNPYSRMMFNYVFTQFDRVATTGGPLVTGLTMNTFEMRAQFDF